MAQTRTPLCRQACITQLCPAARCWDMRCVGEPRRKGRPCLGSSCTGRSCQELRVLPSAGTSFLLSLPPDFFLKPRIIGTGLGPAACLPPLHTKLFSVLSPSPALGREGAGADPTARASCRAHPLQAPPPVVPAHLAHVLGRVERGPLLLQGLSSAPANADKSQQKQKLLPQH